MEIQNSFPGEPAPRPCWSCGAIIGGRDNFCKNCGKGQNSYVSWHYQHWGVIGLTFLVGPFSLFYVWRSPVISRNARIAYTGFILLLTWFVFNSLYRMWTALQSVMGGAQIY